MLSNARYLIVLLSLLLSCSARGQDQFADKSYYLIDSLNLDELTQHDRNLLDSTLTLYHKVSHDTDRLNALNVLCGNMMDESWHRYQQLQYAEVKRMLAGNPGDDLINKYKSILAQSLNNLGYIQLMKGNNARAIEYYDQGKAISEEINDRQAIATYYVSMGYIYRSQGNNLEAIEYYRRGLKISEEIGDREAVAVSLNNIGQVYHKTGDIAGGLEYYLKGLKIYDELGDSEPRAVALSNAGTIYDSQKDFDKALEAFHGSLEMLEKLGDKLGMAMALNNIGGVLKHKGSSIEAVEYFTRSLKLREEVGDKSGMAATLVNIGMSYKDNGGIERALEFCQRGLTIYKELGDREGISWTHSVIGGIFVELDKMDKARDHGDKAMELAREIGYPNDIRNAAELLTMVHKKERNYNEALSMYELFIEMRDSMNNEETNKATIRQQTKYEFEKAQLVKEQEERERARLEAEKMARRNNLQYSIILIGILALFGSVLALGFINVSERMAEGIIFFSFLILFEFLLVLADPYIEGWSGGAPGIKLLFNAGIAALIFPVHAFFETKLKGRLVKRA